jgi:predicted dithiol-disulfide oxidoreductase (DUF899 family)
VAEYDRRGRGRLLVKEKELTRARDRVNADRRRLPMVRIDKPYTFAGPDGTEQPRDYGFSSCSSAADGIPRRLRP